MTAPNAENKTTVDIQWGIDRACVAVNDEKINEWINQCSQVLQLAATEAEVAVRIVGEDEITELNQQYRDKESSTNVLSFDNGSMDESGRVLLGDIVICAPVVCEEAATQNKSVEEHFAHMLVHGLLHLNGFDHIGDEEAREMETLEIKIMKEIRFANPYQESVER
jgi:probable rRNA maturation factor